MAMIVLSLPDDLAARAISKGLLSSERIGVFLTEELTRLESPQLSQPGSETSTRCSLPSLNSPASPAAAADDRVERANHQPREESQASFVEMTFIVNPKLLADALKSLAPHLARVKKVDQYVEFEIVNSALLIVGESGQRAAIDVIGSGRGRFAVDRERLRRVLESFSKRESLEFNARGGALSFAGVRISFVTVPKRRVVALR